MYKKIFRPYGLFNGVKIKCPYDRYFKIEADLNDWIQQQIFFFGVYDPSGINFLKKSLKPGDIFFDVGANIGIYSLTASRLVSSDEGGAIYAFEPAVHVYEKLLQNISLNQIRSIHPQKFAVHDKSAVLELYLSSTENLGMSSIFRHDHESGMTEKVQAIRLDDFVLEHGIKHVDFIKIDIEGAEIFALKGMQKILEKHLPLLMLEISENVLEGNEISSSDVFDFLKQRGYEPYVLDAAGNISIPVTLSIPGVTNYVFLHSDAHKNLI